MKHLHLGVPEPYKSWAQRPLTFEIARTPSTRQGCTSKNRNRSYARSCPALFALKCDLCSTPEGGCYFQKEGGHLMEFHVSVATQWLWWFQAPPTRVNWFNRTAPASGTSDAIRQCCVPLRRATKHTVPCPDSGKPLSEERIVKKVGIPYAKSSKLFHPSLFCLFQLVLFTTPG
jgi:hypothetical protein